MGLFLESLLTYTGRLYLTVAFHVFCFLQRLNKMPHITQSAINVHLRHILLPLDRAKRFFYCLSAK